MTDWRMVEQCAAGEGRYGIGYCVMGDEMKSGDRVRRRAIAITRILQTQAKPCMCSQRGNTCWEFHSYKPLGKALDAYAYRLFRLYDEAGAISVTVLPTILRLSERGELPLCRSQLPRLLACAISLNAKYWDDGAANETVYLRMCELAGISPDVFATMEMEMLSRLQWSLGMTKSHFDAWEQIVDSEADWDKLEPWLQSRNSSSDLRMDCFVYSGRMNPSLPRGIDGHGHVQGHVTMHDHGSELRAAPRQGSEGGEECTGSAHRREANRWSDTEFVLHAFDRLYLQDVTGGEASGQGQSDIASTIDGQGLAHHGGLAETQGGLVHGRQHYHRPHPHPHPQQQQQQGQGQGQGQQQQGQQGQQRQPEQWPRLEQDVADSLLSQELALDGGDFLSGFLEGGDFLSGFGPSGPTADEDDS